VDHSCDWEFTGKHFDFGLQRDDAAYFRVDTHPNVRSCLWGAPELFGHKPRSFPDTGVDGKTTVVCRHATEIANSFAHDLECAKKTRAATYILKTPQSSGPNASVGELSDTATQIASTNMMPGDDPERTPSAALAALQQASDAVSDSEDDIIVTCVDDGRNKLSERHGQKVTNYNSQDVPKSVTRSFGIRRGDPLCGMCRGKLDRKIKAAKVQFSQTWARGGGGNGGKSGVTCCDAQCDEPSQQHDSKKIWHAFAIDQPTEIVAFDQELEHRFPYVDVPAALAQPFAEICRGYEVSPDSVSSKDVVPKMDSAKHKVMMALCMQGHHFLGQATGRALIMKDTYIFSGLQRRHAKLLDLGNTDMIFSELNKCGVANSKSWCGRELTRLATEWKSRLDLKPNCSKAAWIDNFELIFWHQYFTAIEGKVPLASLGGDLPSDEELAAIRCRCPDGRGCVTGACSCNKAGFPCSPKLCLCSCNSGLTSGRTNPRGQFIEACETKMERMSPDEHAKNTDWNPVSVGRSESHQSLNYHQTQCLVANLSNIDTDGDGYTNAQCQPHHSDVSAVQPQELTLSGFRQDLTHVASKRLEAFWLTGAHNAALLRERPLWSQEFADGTLTADFDGDEVLDASGTPLKTSARFQQMYTEIAMAVDQPELTDPRRDAPDDEPPYWHQSLLRAHRVFELYSRDHFLDKKSKLPSVLLALRNEYRDQKKDVIVKHRNEVDEKFMTALKTAAPKLAKEGPVDPYAFASRTDTEARAYREKLRSLLRQLHVRDEDDYAPYPATQMRSLRALKEALAAAFDPAWATQHAIDSADLVAAPANAKITAKMYELKRGTAQNSENCERLLTDMMVTGEISREATSTGEGHRLVFWEAPAAAPLAADLAPLVNTAVNTVDSSVNTAVNNSSSNVVDDSHAPMDTTGGVINSAESEQSHDSNNAAASINTRDPAAAAARVSAAQVAVKFYRGPKISFLSSGADSDGDSEDDDEVVEASEAQRILPRNIVIEHEARESDSESIENQQQHASAEDDSSDSDSESEDVAAAADEPSWRKPSSTDYRWATEGEQIWTAPSRDAARPVLPAPDAVGPNEPLFFICSDYAIQMFFDEATRREQPWKRMVECYALLHFSFGVLEAWVEKYHSCLKVGDDMATVLNITSESQKIFVTNPHVDVRKMLQAHRQYCAAVGLRIHRLIHAALEHGDVLLPTTSASSSSSTTPAAGTAAAGNNTLNTASTAGCAAAASAASTAAAAGAIAI
jgi:hypothetical protein